MAVADQFSCWAGVDRVAADKLLQEGWTIHPWMAGDEMACIAIMHGPEIHFVAAPKWRGRLILRKRTQEFLAPLMDRHGYLTTRADPADGHRDFLERLGFVFTWSDGLLDHFMMHKLPFIGKDKTCPQLWL